MAKKPKRPTIRLGHIAGGALIDLGRRSPAILPVAAVAFAGPFVAAFAIAETFRSAFTPLWALLIIVCPMIVLGTAMQSLVIEISAADLRPIKANWRPDLALGARTFAVDLILNLGALAVVFVTSSIGALVLGVSRSMARRGSPDIPWWAVVGGLLAALPTAYFLSRWAVASVSVHVDGQGVFGALGRSAELSTGQRRKISVFQTLYLWAWPGAVFAFLYPARALHLNNDATRAVFETLSTFLGLLAALDALAKVRLYRELVTTQGEMGSANLADVFD